MTLFMWCSAWMENLKSIVGADLIDLGNVGGTYVLAKAKNTEFFDNWFIISVIFQAKIVRLY